MRGAMAVFLAGGRGEGLGVLTEQRAAGAVPFAGKYRLVDFSLSNCRHSELSSVALLTQHAPTSLNEHVGSGRPWGLDHPEGGVRVLQPFAWRERAAWYAGASDALLRNLTTYEETGVLRVVVGSAEHVYFMDYSELLAAHVLSNCPITLAVMPVPLERRRRSRMVEVQDGRVRRLENRPDRTGLELASMGVFVFDMDFLRAVGDERVSGPIGELVQAALTRGVPVHAYPFDGYWEDLGDLATYYRASMALLGSEPPLRLDDPLWPVETRAEERPPARFVEGCRVHDSLVAGGAVIEGEVERSIVFGGAFVGRGARVIDSIVFQDARVAEGAILDRVILDKLVEVGEGAMLGDGPLPDGREGVSALCVVGKEARIPPGLRLARGSTVPVGADLTMGEVEASAEPAEAEAGEESGSGRSVAERRP